MTRAQIADIISRRPIDQMETITTVCRPAEKSNTILVTEIEGKKWYCERPRYEWSPLDRSFFEKPFVAEERLLYSNIAEPMGVFDARGLWWAREEMSSIGLVPYFLKNPALYLRMMARHTANVSLIVSAIQKRAETFNDPRKAADNLGEFIVHYERMYDSFATIFMAFDELAFQFRQFLLAHCAKAQVNTYFPLFMSGEATKEALAAGYLDSEEPAESALSRGVLYAMYRTPRLFYAQPKFFHSFDDDGATMRHLIDNGISDENLERFLAFRTIVPAGFQINEESQYMESMILSPHLGIVMRAASATLGRSIDELTEMRVEDIIHELRKKASRTFLTGIPASQGVARGKVKIVHGVQDEELFCDGDILVTRITNPTMVSMMARAGAIVCDIGSITSHPSIVSRELGIPCVVATEKATDLLADGDEVIVDGDRGTVSLV